MNTRLEARDLQSRPLQTFATEIPRLATTSRLHGSLHRMVDLSGTHWLRPCFTVRLPATNRESLTAHTRAFGPPLLVLTCGCLSLCLCLCLFADHILSTLKRMPRLSEPGPLGMRAEHWYDFGTLAGDNNVFSLVMAHIATATLPDAVLQYLRAGQVSPLASLRGDTDRSL